MAKQKSFIKQFWQEKKMVGAMSPSSKYLANKMLNPIDFKKARVIVELGPGTGVFTKRMLAQMQPDAKLLVFELNDAFFETLQSEINDPRMILIHDSAEHVQKYLQANDLLQTDYVVSSLPLANFPLKLKKNIIESSYNSLKNNGKYIQFQYSLNSKKVLEEQFQSVSLAFTPFNFPPAFVYTCTKEKN